MTDTDVAVRQQIRDWWKRQLEGKGNVQITELARKAESIFRLDPSFCRNFTETFLYAVLYDCGITMLSERRAVMGPDGEWIGDPSPWMEYDPSSKRHISIVEMTPEQALSAAQFREANIATEQERIQMLKDIANGSKPQDVILSSVPTTSLRDKLRLPPKAEKSPTVDMSCADCGSALMAGTVIYPRSSADWQCQTCGKYLTKEQGEEIDREGMEPSGSEGVTLWERLYGPVGSDVNPYLPTPHGSDPRPFETSNCFGCGQSVTYPVDHHGHCIDSTLWESGFCRKCCARYPDSLRKAHIDPFDYAMGLRTGETIRFYQVEIFGAWVHVKLTDGASYPDRLDKSFRSLPFGHARGIDIRVDDIVWCCDAPYGS